MYLAFLSKYIGSTAFIDTPWVFRQHENSFTPKEEAKPCDEEMMMVRAFLLLVLVHHELP
jgi:hypothetical protein